MTAEEHGVNLLAMLPRMNEETLWAFWGRYHRPSRKDAAALVGDRRKGYIRIAQGLANWACNKAVAMKCRSNSDPTAAACYEHAARICFDSLPADIQAAIST